MSFGPVLEQILRESRGALAVILMGRDGIAIEQAECQGLAPDESERIGNASVEFARILEEVRKASDAFAGGEVRETVVGLDRYWIVLRPVDDETLLVVALEPDGSLGKARFVIRRHLHAIRELL